MFKNLEFPLLIVSSPCVVSCVNGSFIKNDVTQSPQILLHVATDYQE